MLAASGAVLGTFSIYLRAPTAPDEVDLYLLEQAARLASITISRTQMLQTLRKNEAQLRSLVQTIPDLVWMKDLAGHYLAVNPAVERLVGKSEAEILGKTDYDLLPRERAEIQRAQDLEAIAKPAGMRTEEFLHFADGTHQGDYETIKTATLDAEGRVIGVLGISREITERKTLTASLRQAKEQAEAAAEAKSLFLANMSHEIRTPLNAVVGISELMQDVGDNPRTVSYAATIRKSALSLLGIINDVLDLSRIEAGGMSLRKERCEIGTLVRDLMDMFQPVAEGKQLTLQLELAADLPPALRADTVRVRQILVNLLGNAVKFTSTGGVWLGVSRDQAPDGTPQLVLLVKDTGIGIRRDALQELFKPFVRVHDRDLPGQTGTGLGLSITAELVRLMGGTITVESTLGRGSSFEVRLPLEEDLSPAVATRRAVAQDSGRVRGRRRVLLVEDNPVNQLVATELLISLGCEVITADSGADGLRAMNDGSFDLVLMDCQMPVMDGFEATRRWRAHEQQMGVHRLPVVALTANAITGDRELCIAAGMDDYLTKPVSREQLEDVLQAFLGAPADAGA